MFWEKRYGVFLSFFCEDLLGLLSGLRRRGPYIGKGARRAGLVRDELIGSD